MFELALRDLFLVEPGARLMRASALPRATEGFVSCPSRSFVPVHPSASEGALRHMLGALFELESASRITAADALELRDYLDMAANSLVNSP